MVSLICGRIIVGTLLQCNAGHLVIHCTASVHPSDLTALFTLFRTTCRPHVLVMSGKCDCAALQLDAIMV